MQKKGLNPLINKETKILILGSLPSDESIKGQQYYSNPNNDFWEIISAVIHEDITKLAYALKIKKLMENGIGLWDVCKSAERTGSMDSKIRNYTMNDFSNLNEIIPNIKLICFNGQKAGEFEIFFREKGFKTKILLSSSGSNRKYLKSRLAEWKSIFPIT